MQRLRIIFTVFLVVFGILIVDSIYAQRAVYRPDIRAMGMGNAYTALATGPSAMSYNPAGLSISGFNLEILGMQAAVNQRFLNAATFIQDNVDNFSDFENLSDQEASRFLQDMDPFDDRYVGLRLGPQVALTMLNLGFAAYTEFKPDVRLDKGIYVPRIYTKGYLDAVGAVGYGREISVPGVNSMHAGITAKYVMRYEIEAIKMNAQDAQDPSGLSQTMLDTLPDPLTGVLFDVGVLSSPAPNLTVGLHIQDIGSLGVQELPMRINIGGAYNVSMLSDLPVLRSAVVAMDIRDAFNSQGTSLFQRLHFGAEVGLPLLRLRAGLNQGYVTTGFGINLFLLHLDYAYFGQEMGASLGWNPEFSHVIQLGVGI
ncbi:MAG: hypothetical protein K9N46_11825 [Candidatus Marinimicrobia bacterium]|nr:hypothetical protein [Candidatus Neomarinimicrobiota bacterium]MCF7827350.1 hypothetical protein [Candidatus Neomarinimicrobiota bacterium]MCF7881417.1 hypothetical protein [Candidatus Neomarinimicrobiota bacterium]